MTFGDHKLTIHYSYFCYCYMMTNEPVNFFDVLFHDLISIVIIFIQINKYCIELIDSEFVASFAVPCIINNRPSERRCVHLDQ